MTPIVGICGPAGSGKDTVAGFLVSDHGAVAIAQADPLKRFAKTVFGFTDEQLWGPSECRNAVDPRGCRNAVDPRGTNPDFWEMLSRNFAYEFGAPQLPALVSEWLDDVGLHISRKESGRPENGEERLVQWFEGVCNQETLTPRHVLQTLGTEFGRYLKDSVWVDYAQNVALKLLSQGGTYNRATGVTPGGPPPKFVCITDVRFPNEVVGIKSVGGVVIKVDSPDTAALAGAAGKHASETQQALIPEEWFDAVLVNDKKNGLEALRTNVDLLKFTLFPRPPVIGAAKPLPMLTRMEYVTRKDDRRQE